MKFADKFPGAASIRVAYPDSLLGPHPDIQVSDTVTQTFRLFPCCICGEKTGFRVSAEDTETACCGEECQSENLANIRELRGTEEKEKIDIGSVDTSNLSEVQLAAPQSEQSSSTDGKQGVSHEQPLRSESPVVDPPGG